MGVTKGGGRNLVGRPDVEKVETGVLGDHPTPHPPETGPYRAVWGFYIIYYITVLLLGNLEGVRCCATQIMGVEFCDG